MTRRRLAIATAVAAVALLAAGWIRHAPLADAGAAEEAYGPTTSAFRLGIEKDVPASPP